MLEAFPIDRIQAVVEKMGIDLVLQQAKMVFAL